MDQKSQGLGSSGSLCPNSMTYTLYSSRAGPLTPWGLCLYHSLSLECQIPNTYPPLSLARPPNPQCSALGNSVVGREEFIGSVPTVPLVSRTAFSMRVAASEASKTVLPPLYPQSQALACIQQSGGDWGQKRSSGQVVFQQEAHCPICQYV